MKDLHELTDLQMAIMDEIWSRGEGTVTTVHAALKKSTRLAKKTIGTMLARMEKQALVVHWVEGREFIYTATVSRDEVREAKVRNVRDRLFSGNVLELVSHALESNDVRSGDVERVRQLIEKWKERKR